MSNAPKPELQRLTTFFGGPYDGLQEWITMVRGVETQPPFLIPIAPPSQLDDEASAGPRYQHVYVMAQLGTFTYAGTEERPGGTL